MSVDNHWSGEIRIVPPLTWDEIEHSPFLPQEHRRPAGLTQRRRDVEFRIVKQETPGGFALLAEAIVPILGTFAGRAVLTDLAEIAARHSDRHTFEGRIDCILDPGYGAGASRLEITDGRAAETHATVMWPEDFPPPPRYQASTDPADTAHLRAGDRITLTELATELGAVAVWLRQLAIAAETPAVPVELGDMCDQLDQTAADLSRKAEVIADVDQIITERRPLRPFFPTREPWGLRAHGSDRDKWGKRLSTVLSHRQINSLALADMPWRDEEPGITYLDGIAGLPGLDAWESPRAARRRAAARAKAIDALARQILCPTCSAPAGRDCTTKTGRLAEQLHRPRVAAATTDYDTRTTTASAEAPAEADQTAPTS